MYSKKIIGAVLSAVLAVVFLVGCGEGSDHEAIEGQEIAILTTPPEVPPPINRNHATKVTDVTQRDSGHGY